VAEKCFSKLSLSQDSGDLARLVGNLCALATVSGRLWVAHLLCTTDYSNMARMPSRLSVQGVCHYMGGSLLLYFLKGGKSSYTECFLLF
jgi:hypothetical protein